MAPTIQLGELHVCLGMERSMRAEGRAQSDTPSGKRDHFSFLLPRAEKMCTFQ